MSQPAIVAVAVGVAVFGGVAPADATAAGEASAGLANVVDDGQPVSVAPLAECSVTGQRQGSSDGVDRKGVVAFGSASSTCTVDAAKHTSTSTAKGSAFTLSALRAYGGPAITVADYQVTCTATTETTNASWSFSGLTGFTVPKQIPNNYQVQVKSDKGAVLADVTMNQVVLPDPNDGSITSHMMDIKLFPDGVPAGVPMSGDVIVGSTSCSPTS